VITSPYGEAVCPACHMLIGLNASGLFEYHGGQSLIAHGCRFSGCKPPAEPVTADEIPEAAFSSEPRTALCGRCGQSAELITVGYSEHGYRFRDHDVPGGLVLCAASGEFVTPISF